MNKLEILELLYEIFEGHSVFFNKDYQDLADDIWLRIKEENNKIQEEKERRLRGLI